MVFGFALCGARVVLVRCLRCLCVLYYLTLASVVRAIVCCRLVGLVGLTALRVDFRVGVVWLV